MNQAGPAQIAAARSPLPDNATVWASGMARSRSTPLLKKKVHGPLKNADILNQTIQNS